MKHKLLQLLGDNARADRSTPAVRADASGDTAKIYVYDVIDSYWGASAKDLIDALQAAGDKPVHLHINSPGGDVFEARAMVAAVRAHAPGVTAYIDGVAASAATYLALSGQAVHMQEGAMFMVHNAWTVVYGNKAELRTTADFLDKVDGTIAADYAKKTGATADQITAWMDAETWFTAEEAKAAGFVDSVITGTAAQAQASAGRWNLSAYAHAPKLQTSAPPPAGPTEAELTAAADRQQRFNRARLAALALQIDPRT